MSTRSTTHIGFGQDTIAIIYRHQDGGPSGQGRFLHKFIRDCKKLNDSRLEDPSYLAARLVVALADECRQDGNPNPLDFVGVGIVDDDPFDIEYRYTIDCGDIHLGTGLPALSGVKIGKGTGTTAIEEDKPIVIFS